MFKLCAELFLKCIVKAIMVHLFIMGCAILDLMPVIGSIKMK